mmetsp:Transcript_2301/g.4408  ORF Transcript_2301/g.4408 Transcript_2301/m.4408 type:complete len:287 (-) Transcript_2301:809-1669(-)
MFNTLFFCLLFVFDGNNNGFLLQIVVQCRSTKLSANARLLETSKRSGGIKHVKAVDIDGSSSDGLGYIDRFPNVACAHAGAEPIDRAVSSLDGLVEFGPLEHTHNRAKDFLLSNSVVILDICKDRGLNVVPFISDAASSSGHRRPFSLSFLNVAHHTVKLKLVDLRTMRGVLMERVSSFEALCLLDCELDKLVVYSVLHHDPRARNAALPLIEEEASVSRLYGLLEISVFANDQRRLSAKLKRDSLDVLSSEFLDLAAHRSRACKSHLVYVLVANQRLARGWAKSA